jgi:citrate lyase synthetase
MSLSHHMQIASTLGIEQGEVVSCYEGYVYDKPEYDPEAKQIGYVELFGKGDSVALVRAVAKKLIEYADEYERVLKLERKNAN